MVLLNITSVARISYPQLLTLGRSCGLYKNHLTSNFMPQIAFITSKAMREGRPPRPPPFDWMNKQYKLRHAFTDPMDERFDENSRIVVVEGLPAVGKDKFAMKLAEELEMLYMPQPSYDDIFINPYGFDYRTLNDRLPIDAQYFDEKMFLSDPYNRNTAAMQHSFYMLRLDRYIEALTHVLSTGQGVVLQRCPWSDIVFMKAMHDAGYVSKGGYDYYKSALAATLHRIFKPHLVIYLDVPAAIVKEKIQKRGLPHEVNSQVLTPKYLSDIEANYKNLYLPDISKHAHLLIYNWVEENDITAVVDDIEQMQFEDYGRESSKMSDWNFATLEARRVARSEYANNREQLVMTAVIARVDVPEMTRSAEDNIKLTDILDSLKVKEPGHRFSAGFNPRLDKGVWWKTRANRDDYKFASDIKMAAGNRNNKIFLAMKKGK